MAKDNDGQSLKFHAWNNKQLKQVYVAGASAMLREINKWCKLNCEPLVATACGCSDGTKSIRPNSARKAIMKAGWPSPPG